MANFNKHLAVGAIVGTVAGAGIFLFQYSTEKEENPEVKFHWGKFLQLTLAGCALGALTGIAADKFEPALNPNHRGFFHSYSIWILAGLTVLEILSGKKDLIWKNLAIIGFAGYSSHLPVLRTFKK
jgi:membrane-bound metal-dependent hydrolase YbcI (DUF457 family)